MAIRQKRAAASRNGGNLDMGKWREFVKKGGLSNQPACTYYLGAGNEPKNAKDTKTCEKLLQEALLDACALGAITPPTDTKPEELVVSIGTNATYYSVPITISVVRKGKAIKKAESNTYLDRYVGSTVKLPAFSPMLNVLGTLVTRL